MNEIYISDMQFNAIKSRKSVILYTTPKIKADTSADNLNLIINESDKNQKIIAQIYTSRIFNSDTEIYESYHFNEEYIKSDFKQKYIEEITKLIKKHNTLSELRIWCYLLSENSEISWTPFTLILYHKIQWLRHLPVKHNFFCMSMKNEDKILFEKNILIIEKTIDFIYGKVSYDEYIKIFPDSTKYIKDYHNFSEISDFRKNILSEIIENIDNIKLFYSEKKYLKIRDIAYKIHNLPEIIRTENDWRETN